MITDIDSIAQKYGLQKKSAMGTSRMPDVVAPYRDQSKASITQQMGENPNSTQYGYGPGGHMGTDFSSEDTRVTNPIGGINVSGFQPRGYGNFQVVVGASPAELQQMAPETKEQIRKQVSDYMMGNPADISGLQIPGKNVSIQAHLAQPAPADSEIATGSANLVQGGSGGWAPHLHSEFKDVQGNMRSILDLIRNRAK